MRLRYKIITSCIGKECFCWDSWFDKIERLTYNILNKVAGRWVPSPDSAKYIVYVVKNSRPNFTRAQDGYFLFVYVKIAIMSKAVVSIICNSSYVLIIITLSVRLKSDESTSPSYLVKYIIWGYYNIFKNKNIAKI